MKIRVVETGGRGNKHFNPRRPNGPLCPNPGCGEKFAPICPNLRCEGSLVPRGIMRQERMDHGVRRLTSGIAQSPTFRRQVEHASQTESKPEPRPERRVETVRRERQPAVSTKHLAKLQSHYDQRRTGHGS